MDYDIRTPELATQTLSDITGIPYNFWVYESYLTDGNVDADYLYDIIEKYNGHLLSFEDLYLIISHITTSANGCIEIAENGIGDLQSAYRNPNSELRQFLDINGIDIRIDNSCLVHNGTYYSIEYDRYGCPLDDESIEYKGWCVGRRFYSDNGLCGFFAIDSERPYGGDVHKRPEILYNIDDLLNTNLVDVWKNSHTAYEVIIKIHSSELELYEHIDDEDETKVIRLLINAFYEMCSGSSEVHAQCKPNVKITPEKIVDILPFDKWQ